MSLRRLLLVAAAALLCRGAFILAMGPASRYAWAPDTNDYAPLARSLVLRQRFSKSEQEPYVAETFRTPGYPAFLALFCPDAEACPSERAAVWAQAAVGALACVLLSLCAFLLFGDALAATAAGLGLAVDLVTVLHTGLLLTETLFTSVFVAGLLALAWAWRGGPERAGRAFLAGLAFGLAALIRPAGLYFFLFGGAALALAWAGRPRRAAALALFVCGATLIPTAWCWRNFHATGRFTFTPIQGLNIAYMRAAGVEMRLAGVGYDDAVRRVKTRIEAEHGGPFADEKDEAAFAQRWSLRFLARHALTYAEVMAADTIKMLGGHGLEIVSWTVLRDPDDDPQSPKPPKPTGGLSGTRDLVSRHPGLAPVLLLYGAFLVATYGLALGGFLTALTRKEAGPAILALAPILYFVAISAGALAYYRLRIPLMPAVFLLAGRGLTAARHGGSGRPDAAGRNPAARG